MKTHLRHAYPTIVADAHCREVPCEVRNDALLAAALNYWCCRCNACRSQGSLCDKFQTYTYDSLIDSSKYALASSVDSFESSSNSLSFGCFVCLAATERGISCCCRNIWSPPSRGDRLNSLRASLGVAMPD